MKIDDAVDKAVMGIDEMYFSFWFRKKLTKIQWNPNISLSHYPTDGDYLSTKLVKTTNDSAVSSSVNKLIHFRRHNGMTTRPQRSLSNGKSLFF